MAICSHQTDCPLHWFLVSDDLHEESTFLPITHTICMHALCWIVKAVSVLYNTEQVLVYRQSLSTEWISDLTGQMKISLETVPLQTDFLVSSADFTIYTPRIGTLSHMVSSPLGKYNPFFSAVHITQHIASSVPPDTHVLVAGPVWTFLYMTGTVD